MGLRIGRFVIGKIEIHLGAFGIWTSSRELFRVRPLVRTERIPGERT